MKNMVITGCNRGLGEGIKDVFNQNKYDVFGLNRTPSKEIIPDYTEFLCDITNENELEYLIKVNKMPKQIDVLVINAAIRRFNDIQHMGLNEWQDSINVNMTGAFVTIKKLLPFIKKSKGDIIIIGSHSEKYTFENGAAYCSTKLALKGLSECLMEEVRYDDVRVSYLSLGAIKNREHGYDEDWKLFPREVGETVLSLVNLPKKVCIPYLDVRPLKPLKSPLSGIERLQYV